MSLLIDSADNLELRKARGAFFTPTPLCDYLVEWAVRRSDDRVLEPSCGEAAFLFSAGLRLTALRGSVPATGQLQGVELHPESARRSQQGLAQASLSAEIRADDFFNVEPIPQFDAVVGNPPYVRYQDFSGTARARSRAAALRAGVSLTGLASSWAAFAVHASQFLRREGRLGLVLPAELLTVNYAADVRRYLMERFASVRLVLFTERVFPGVLEEVVLLMAEGIGPSDHCELYQVRDFDELAQLTQPTSRWKPRHPHAKWTPSLVRSEALSVYERLLDQNAFSMMEEWGETTLGMVTGNNGYFALSPHKANELGLSEQDVVPLSPPGSSHLRSVTLSETGWRDLGLLDRPTLLFRPKGEPSRPAGRYIKSGESAGVDTAYKCRVRSPWWRVPLVPPADLLLTYMNADTPRLCANRAGVHHLNSVHGVYLKDGLKRLGMDVLPLASLNTVTLLGAETVGRSYGGGMLKLEPKEADRLPVPSKFVLNDVRSALSELRKPVRTLLRQGQLMEAVRTVDEVLLVKYLKISKASLQHLRVAHAELHSRRVARGARPSALR